MFTKLNVQVVLLLLASALCVSQVTFENHSTDQSEVPEYIEWRKNFHDDVLKRKLAEPFRILAGVDIYRLMAVCGKSRHHPDLPATVLIGDLLSMCQDWEELRNLPEERSTDPIALMYKIMKCVDCGWVVGINPQKDVRLLIDGWEDITSE